METCVNMLNLILYQYILSSIRSLSKDTLHDILMLTTRTVIFKL